MDVEPPVDHQFLSVDRPRPPDIYVLSVLAAIIQLRFIYGDRVKPLVCSLDVVKLTPRLVENFLGGLILLHSSLVLFIVSEGGSIGTGLLELEGQFVEVD